MVWRLPSKFYGAQEATPSTDWLMDKINTYDNLVANDKLLHKIWWVISFISWQGVDQMISDLSLWENINHVNIRQRFSELKRLHAYGLELYQYFDLPESERLHITSMKHKKQRLSYVRTTQSLKLKWSEYCTVNLKVFLCINTPKICHGNFCIDITASRV